MARSRPDPEPVLLVFARYPEPGRVKTRIAAAVGDAVATALYRAFLDDLAARFSPSAEWRLCWVYEPAGSPFPEVIGRGSAAFVQSPGNLGERMAAAIGEAIGRGAGSVVLIGSDLPHLPVERLREALVALGDGAPLVLGPADDGGYYLIGARSVPPVFETIPWGTERVFSETLARSRAAGIEPSILPSLYDLDTLDDLRRLADDREALARVPRTRTVLERMGIVAPVPAQGPTGE